MTTATQARALAASGPLIHLESSDLICNTLNDMADNVDELVAALKACAGVCAGYGTQKSTLVDALEKARAILAKLDEEAAVRAVGVQP